MCNGLKVLWILLLTHLGGDRRWVPLILAWYQASHAQWEKRVKKNGVKFRKIWASDPAAAQRWPPFLLLRLPLGSLRSPIFPPMGSLVPGLNMNS